MTATSLVQFFWTDVQRINRTTLLLHDRKVIAKQAKPLLAYTAAFAVLAIPMLVYVIWAEIDHARTPSAKAQNTEDLVRSSCMLLLAGRGEA